MAEYIITLPCSVCNTCYRSVGRGSVGWGRRKTVQLDFRKVEVLAGVFVHDVFEIRKEGNKRIKMCFVLLVFLDGQ